MSLSKSTSTDRSASFRSETLKSPKKSAKSKMSDPEAQVDQAFDIIDLILEDHKPLKRLIKIMKDTDQDMRERMAAFGEFAPLLVTHAKPEEQTLYVKMKASQEEDVRVEGLEGDVEHMLADQLLEEIKRIEDKDQWTATVKVLAELVEHHIEEEESELLPDYKKDSEPAERLELGRKFLKLKSELEGQGSDDAPPEALVEENSKDLTVKKTRH